MLARIVTAILLGVIWVFYLAFLGGMALEAELWVMILFPTAYLVTIGAVFAIPWIHRPHPGIGGAIRTLLMLTAAPSVVVLYATGWSLAGWWKLIALNAVFAVTALIAFRALVGFEGQRR
ncbi:hypothetical protein [Pelagibius sp.]|uniref:hypothetical protein n=1 Tax=Pelagibius sp. TaxID=1931238 RepID=UPI002628555C|nr:hypothetical protein [Pelagibius sp.]